MNSNIKNKEIIIGIIIGFIFSLIVVGVLFLTGIIDFKEKIIDDKESNNVNSKIEEIVGIYEFYEFAEPDQNMIYELQISNDYTVILNIDGFQTIKRIKANLEYKNGKYDVIYDENLNDDQRILYKKGDVLFSLYEDNSEIYTSWNLLQPMLENNKKDGVYFKVKTGNLKESDIDNTSSDFGTLDDNISSDFGTPNDKILFNVVGDYREYAEIYIEDGNLVVKSSRYKTGVSDNIAFETKDDAYVGTTKTFSIDGEKIKYITHLYYQPSASSYVLVLTEAGNVYVNNIQVINKTIDAIDNFKKTEYSNVQKIVIIDNSNSTDNDRVPYYFGAVIDGKTVKMKFYW